MQLFVGLGNPGAKYEKNRHNIGFMALDRIAEDHGFGPWRAKFQGHVSEGALGGTKVILLKPGTFMNLSGQAVGEAIRFYKLTPGDVTVFHDELDLAPGKLKVKQSGGHAGHNGLRSIHQHIGEAYQRVRLGIGHPGHRDRVAQFVLQDFAKADANWLDDLMRGISDGAPWLAGGKPDRGFVYYVSITGITGAAAAEAVDVGPEVARIKAQTDLPVIVGFGIRTPETAQTIASVADGAVVGSAIVGKIADGESVADVLEFVRGLAAGAHRA